MKKSVLTFVVLKILAVVVFSLAVAAWHAEASETPVDDVAVEYEYRDNEQSSPRAVPCARMEEDQVAGLDCLACGIVCLIDPTGVACAACLAACLATPI